MTSSISDFLESTIGSNPVLLTITAVSFLIKGYLFVNLISQWNKKIIQLSYFLFLLILIGTMISDVSWIFLLFRRLFFPMLSYNTGNFLLRIAWAFASVYHQALALFIVSLINSKYIYSWLQKIFIFISSLFVIFFVGLALFNYNQTFDLAGLEFFVKKAGLLYHVLILLPISLIYSIKKSKKAGVSLITKKQLNIITLFFVPILITDFIHAFPLKFPIDKAANSHAAVTITTVLFACALYFSARKMLRLRFFNIKKHVQAPFKFRFLSDFREVLTELNDVEHMNEFAYITGKMFKDTFALSANDVQLKIRCADYEKEAINNQYSRIDPEVEAALSTTETKISKILSKHEILIYDEIKFNLQHDPSTENNRLIQFLDKINADIFLPVREKDKTVAYIIVARNSRPKNIYNDVERDEMILFASYLAKNIMLIHQKNFYFLLCERKKMKEEIFGKHQEVNLYKESIKSFLGNIKQQDIGTIFYKKNRFTFGDPISRDMIGINLNVQVGHQLARKLKKLAHEVEDYKTVQRIFITNDKGIKFFVVGMLNLDNNNVILLVYRPEVTDIIIQQTEILRDPTKWDFLLYLETTKSGRLINQLIPGTGKTLLNFKISLLKAAISNKAILLDMPEADIQDTVELLHAVSLRENFKELPLKYPQNNFEDIISLFGINPFLASQCNNIPLLERLNGTGTLFIKNIHFLSLTAQEKLAQFIRYGFYYMFKSEQRVVSNVRIICSSDEDLKTLVLNGTFSKKLYNELQKTTITMPSLITLPEGELENLVEGISEQFIIDSTFKSLLALTPGDRKRFNTKRLPNMKNLKAHVKQLLEKKSKENNIHEDAVLDQSCGISDPLLREAARGGKETLKDPKMMAMLMKKFDNNQNKIATFLGVNRSSVNRRFNKHTYEKQPSNEKLQQ